MRRTLERAQITNRLEKLEKLEPFFQQEKFDIFRSLVFELPVIFGH